MLRLFTAIFFIVMGLTGCAGMRMVDTDVRSFATPPGVPLGATYRFERLPSQQADAAQQNRLEVIVQQALSKVGLQRNDAAASYSVQIAIGMKVDPYSPWDRPSPGWMPGLNLGFGLHSGNVMVMGNGPYMPGFGMGELPYYWRQVSLIVRKLNTSQVVYETHAAHDGRWADSEAILPAMFDAALRDFPHPPPGVRRIHIEIPR